MTAVHEVHDPAEVGMSAERLAFAAALMDRQYAEGHTPMAAAIVARHGTVVFTHTVGDARPGGPALTLDHVFPIASQTKPMTAAVIMALAERGLIGIMEPAALTLPELADEHAEVLVADLLAHTSGWHADDHETARTARLDEALTSIPEGTDVLTHLLLWPGWDVARRTEPGELMQYCNFNYSLLGEIVRRVTGGTLDAAMREYLFEPIGMTSSAMIVGPDLAPRVIERPAGIPYGPDHDFSAISFNDPRFAASDDGASGVHASPRDLHRFWQMILDGGLIDEGTVDARRVLSRDSVRLMTTNQIPGVPAEFLGHTMNEGSWGFGFGVRGHEPFSRFGGGIVRPGSNRHGGAGGIGGWIDPATGVVAVAIEIFTEVDANSFPLSSALHRFEDIVTAAVLD